MALLRRWLHSWAETGDVITGLTRQGLDMELRHGQDGWRAHIYPRGLAYSILIDAATESTHGKRIAAGVGVA